MDWEARVAAANNEDMQKLARRAAERLASSPSPEKAAEAELVLRLVDAERARRSLPGNIASFLEAFPLGFGDSAYLHQERRDKLDASETCLAKLTQEAFREALEGEAAPLVQEVKKIVNMTNLIQGSFEKPKLFDAMQDPSNSRAFLTHLRDLLHGPGEAPDRLEIFSEFLHELGLRKWTYGTYFLFLHDRKNCVFVKPEGLKKAVEITGYPLQYHSTPTARLYRQILAFAWWIDSHLRGSGHQNVKPDDMIDVQSFMWHMAPTGEFAR